MSGTHTHEIITEDLPRWDLSDFYHSPEDSKLQTDMESLQKDVKAFVQKQGTIKNRLSELYDDLMIFQDIAQRSSKLSSYSYLNFATQMTNEKAKAFEQKVSEFQTSLWTDLIFFTHEIQELSDEDMEKAYASNAALKTYKPWLDHTRVYKDHMLELPQEQILVQKDLTSSAAWVRLYDQTLAEMMFKDHKGVSLNLSQVLERMSDPEAAVRQEAAELLSQELSSKKSLLTLIFNTLLKDKEINDNLRRYPSPWTSRHLANQIEEEVVDALVATVKDNYDVCHRYYAWKAKQFGVKRLEYWDRNAPLSHAADPKTSWDDAKKIVFEAYHAFCPKIAAIGKKFFDHDWIDVPAYAGKTSGAFSHPTTPDVHPYLMLNFIGKRRDVMTLAHELGHGVHQYLSNAQPYLLTHTPLTVAETASVFGEMLAFRSMLSKAKTKDEKRSLLAGKIEDMINTVFRQISFHEFEVFLHTKRKEGALSYDDLTKACKKTQREALGDAVHLHPLSHNFWGYISHFLHVPFYVYAYAFGDCLVNSLYSVYLSKTVPDFQERYVHLLSQGGSQTYDNLLKPFGLDPKNKSFWQGGIDVIKELLGELEAL